MRRELGMLATLIVLGLALWASNPAFLGQTNVLNTTRQIAMLGILAIGSAFVIITGGIDLSVGSLVGLTGVIIARVSSQAEGGGGQPIGIGIGVAMAVVLLAGLAQGLLITRLRLQPFIVTLGGMLIFRGVSQTLVRGGTLGFGGSSFPQFADEGLLALRGVPLLSYPVLVFLVIVVLAMYLLHYTVLGRYLYAIGGNRDATEYSGVPVRRVETIAYVISAGAAGIAGIAYAAYIGQMSQNVGLTYELYAIAACVLGGCSLRGGEGSVLGVVVGAAIMRVIENGLNMFRIRYTDANGHPHDWRPDENWKYIVIGGVILVAVILDQTAHLLQARRRIRKAGSIAAQPGLPPAPERLDP